MPAPRLVCLSTPLFPLAARLRSQPELAGVALAICEGNGGAARVTAATRFARRAGVRPGMTLPQARALVPGLTACARDPESERAARESLLEMAESFSPRVEDAGEGVVYLDLGGLERHFPSEPNLGRSLLQAGGKIGLPLGVGIASSKLAARVAAELPGSPTVVAAGEEAAFLAPLPLARLTPESEVAATLRRWGIRSIGDFARLPGNEVSSRLGATGHDLHVRARGLDPRPLVPHQPPPVFREGMELEWPLVDLEPFLFVARAALDRLAVRLELRGLACARLGICLRLEPDGYHERLLTLPAPTRDTRTLLTLVRLDLEAHTPGAPLAAFTLVAYPDRVREAQLTLLGPAALSPDRLATTLARLFALLGSDRVGSPRTVDGHRPERFALVDYAPPPPPELPPEPPAGHGLLAVRVLRPPLPLEVMTAAGDGHRPAAPGDDADERRHPPCEIHALVGEAAAKRPRIQGRVKVASGPWSLEEGWWTDEVVERDYWDVELAGGALYRIFRERRSGDWFADGIYD